MSKAQLKKLNTLTGRLEALQHEVLDSSIKDDLASAKKFLMYALNKAEH